MQSNVPVDRVLPNVTTAPVSAHTSVTLARKGKAKSQSIKEDSGEIPDSAPVRRDGETMTLAELVRRKSKEAAENDRPNTAGGTGNADADEMLESMRPTRMPQPRRAASAKPLTASGLAARALKGM